MYYFIFRREKEREREKEVSERKRQRERERERAKEGKVVEQKVVPINFFKNFIVFLDQS